MQLQQACADDGPTCHPTPASVSRRPSHRVCSRRSGALCRWLALALAAAAAAAALNARLFVWPPGGPLRPADGILFLDGANASQREATALALARRRMAPVVLFSQGAFGQPACPRVARVHVVCFRPHPARTIGEMAFASRYARAHHWRSTIIVAGRAQTFRAGMLGRRCLPGAVMVTHPETPLTQLAPAVVYEWAATLRAVVAERSC